MLLHSGIVYPSERDPSALFAALRRLRERGRIGSADLRLRFRAPVEESLLRGLAARFEVADLVEIEPPLPYRDALAEMCAADGLLVLQAANCNEQIPAKLYEYMRAGRPILGLADPAGDTGQAMRSAGLPHVAALEDANAVASVLARYLDDVGAARAPLADAAVVQRASRRERTAELARILDAAAA